MCDAKNVNGFRIEDAEDFNGFRIGDCVFVNSFTLRDSRYTQLLSYVLNDELCFHDMDFRCITRHLKHRQVLLYYTNPKIVREVF